MIHKIKDYPKESGFTQFDNRTLLNKNLSPTAKIVLLYLISNKEDWEYSEDSICYHLTIGKTQLRTALHQLESLGYLKRTRMYNEKGKFYRYNYEIWEYVESNDDDEPFGM